VLDAQRIVETVARASYARLVSYLAARSRDVAGAEDALSAAFVAALATWPRAGVPDNPEAWLLTAARHRLVDSARRERTRKLAAEDVQSALTSALELSQTSMFPDERLKLLFVCAHPAIDPRIHTPLMLQVVLRLDAEAIAQAFLTPAATIGQRLSRAKTKIREAGIAFEIPDATQLQARLTAVLEAIYAAYGSGYDDLTGVDPRRHQLTEEAIWLARMLVELMPAEPEAQGLLALLLYCESRRAARRSATGEYVPISEQDTQLWSMSRITDADRWLGSAAKHGRLGRFQLEASVQSAHCERARGRAVAWSAIAVLYEGLLHFSPTLGVYVGRAAAVAEAQNAATGLELLEIVSAQAEAYQPYWAVRAHLLAQLQRNTEAHAAYARALELSQDEAVRRFLTQRQSQLTIE
jgi:RNA polymerase sigma-70 factor (ECF subfamily)